MIKWQIVASHKVAETFLSVNVTVFRDTACANNWRFPLHLAPTLQGKSNRLAYESKSAESQLHTYEINRVLRDEGDMIQQNPLLTIGKRVGRKPKVWQQLALCEPQLN